MNKTVTDIFWPKSTSTINREFTMDFMVQTILNNDLKATFISDNYSSANFKCQNKNNSEDFHIFTQSNSQIEKLKIELCKVKVKQL
jgi:hypothetical protein